MATIPPEYQHNSYKRDVITDALKVHDRECCTKDRPCGLRIGLTKQLVTLIGRVVPSVAAEEPSPSFTVREPRSSAVRTDSSATEPQIGLIRRLARERDVTSLSSQLAGHLSQVVGGGLIGFGNASALITRMMALPRLPDDQQPASPRQLELISALAAEMNLTPSKLDTLSYAAASKLIDKLKGARNGTGVGGSTLKDGIYMRPDGNIYMVIHAVHGSGRQYAKKLTILDEPRVLRNGSVRIHTFLKEDGAIRTLTPEMMITKEQAKQFGKLYGACVRCGITLTKEDSKDRSAGDVCFGKMFGA